VESSIQVVRRAHQETTVIARALDEATDTIRHKRRRAFESTVLAAGCAVLAWQALESASLALALAAGAGFELLVTAWSLLSRRELIARLALEPDAYTIPEVVAYGVHLTRPRYRRTLAQGIRKMVREALRPDALYLGDRVLHYARDLEAMARDLVLPNVRVHPASVARCRRLLTEAAESPLYNPKLPEEDIPQTVRRIRAGIQRDD
jgi:hypothetical protein